MAAVADLTARRLAAVLATEQRRGRLPSVAAALARDGSLVWRGGCGGATGSDVGPPDLQYRIGSITKSLTAVLVLQLRDEGRLSLADPVARYLPELPHGDRSLRSLLCHGAGIHAEPPGAWWERIDGGSFAELAAGLTAAAEGSAPPFEPGVTHHYSNVGYALLGEVAARLHGRSWWECVSERVLQPLGMDRTTFAPSAPHAQGYSVAPYTPVLVREPHTATGAMAPAGQLWSTVTDLATFADLLLTGHPDVLPRSTVAEMATPQSGTHADGVGEGYGLGLRMVSGGSGTLVGHTGSMPGFQAGLFVDQGRGTGAVLLANTTTGLSTVAVARRLLETLEESEPTVVDPWVPVDDVPPPVAELVGVWHWGNTPRLLTWDGSVLLMSGLDGERVSRFRLADRRLVGADGYHHGEELDVVRRADGSVSHLVVSTFVMTRVPYDPDAPIPGGPPR